MSPSPRATPRASAHGFDPARRLLDVANAVRRDPAVPRADLARLLAAHGETPADLAPGAFTEADADALRGAARRLTAVLTEPAADRAAAALNDVFAECGARPRLSRHSGHPWHLHVDRGDDAGWADWFLAAGALALAQILTEYGQPAWGECAAPDCTVLYLGTGPGSARRYCSPACASRTRVAAHRRRRAEGDERTVRTGQAGEAGQAGQAGQAGEAGRSDRTGQAGRTGA